MTVKDVAGTSDNRVFTDFSRQVGITSGNVHISTLINNILTEVAVVIIKDLSTGKICSGNGTAGGYRCGA